MALTEAAKERFGLASRAHVDLVLAEEAYLEGMGWVILSKNGCSSTLRHPRSNLVYSRHHALLIEKSDDKTFGGLW